MGNFDGNGYTISNILVDKAITYDGVDYYGLFTKTENAYINNLNINNLRVVVNKSDNLYKVGSVISEVNSLVDDNITWKEITSAIKSNMND